MRTVLEDDGRVYETILRDIYQIDKVLKHKKYRYLRKSYRVFLGGLVLAVLLFLIQFVTTMA